MPPDGHPRRATDVQPISASRNESSTVPRYAAVDARTVTSTKISLRVSCRCESQSGRFAKERSAMRLGRAILPVAVIGRSAGSPLGGDREDHRVGDSDAKEPTAADYLPTAGRQRRSEPAGAGRSCSTRESSPPARPVALVRWTLPLSRQIVAIPRLDIIKHHRVGQDDEQVLEGVR